MGMERKHLQRGAPEEEEVEVKNGKAKTTVGFPLVMF